MFDLLLWVLSLPRILDEHYMLTIKVSIRPVTFALPGDFNIQHALGYILNFSEDGTILMLRQKRETVHYRLSQIVEICGAERILANAH